MSDDLESLLVQLADESRPVRATKLTYLSDLTRAALGQFREAWATFGQERRAELITALVEQAEANIHVNFHAVLRACLRDTDPRVRKQAIEGLWEDEKTSLVAPLVDLLSADPEPEVRAAAAVSLGRFVLLGALGEIADEPAQAASDALLAAWNRRGESGEVRRRALEGLACSTGADLPDMITSAYYDEDERMRESALYAMGRHAHPRWAKFILAELASHEPAMRYEAALAAGEMSLKSAVQPLIRSLDDPDGHVREAAVLALGKIGGAPARRALEALINSGDEQLAQAADDALAELNFNSEQIDDVLLDFSAQPAARSSVADADEADEDWDDEDDLFAEDDAFADRHADARFADDDDFAEDDEGFDEDELDENDDLDWDDEDFDDDLDWR